MAILCQNCRCVTHKKGATACLICGTPFDASLIPAQAGELTSDLQSGDRRNWYVKIVHRRAKNVAILGLIFTATGLAGKSIVRKGMVIDGTELVYLGIAMVVMGAILAFITRPRHA